MVHAREQSEEAPQQIRSAFERTCPVEVLGEQPLAHAAPRAFVRNAKLGDQHTEWCHDVIKRLVHLLHAALADARVIRVD